MEQKHYGGMKPRMGTFFTECVVSNQVARERRTPRRLLVDTGSELTWIDSRALTDIGVTPEKTELFELADGKTVSREVGFALINTAGRTTTDEVVFALEGDLQLLGARSLEGLNLAVDPARERLVAAGPLPAAGALQAEAA